MVRGFVVNTGGASSAEVMRLMNYGVDGLDVAEDAERAKARFLAVAELLGVGDKLVVCSLRDVCDGVEDLLEVLLMWARRRFVLVSLDEEWLEGCWETLCHDGGEALLACIHHQAVPMLGRERTADEQQRGRKTPVRGGRPKGSIKMNEEKLDLAVRMYCQGDFTVRDICDIVRCNERSMYRYLKLRGVAGMRKINGTEAAKGLDGGEA